MLTKTIEQALLLHPAVSAVALVGLAGSRLGQVPVAAISLKSGCTTTAQELAGFVREKYLRHM
ncbi:hypothetical protein [Zhongshania sp.]|uniref:AMP-binding enzyme n=1 Tax=Zhongshania sp. TaxID=1971902 RepID=UPI0035654009